MPSNNGELPGAGNGRAVGSLFCKIGQAEINL
jgi:hypothetical protein